MRTRPQASTTFDQVGVMFDDNITQFNGVVLPLGVDTANIRTFNTLDQVTNNTSPVFDASITFNNSGTLFNGGSSGRDISVQGKIRGSLY